MKDRYYDGIDEDDVPVAPYTSYDRDLDFNKEPETTYVPETDEDWAGVDPDELDEDAENA